MSNLTSSLHELDKARLQATSALHVFIAYFGPAVRPPLLLNPDIWGKAGTPFHRDHTRNGSHWHDNCA